MLSLMHIFFSFFFFFSQGDLLHITLPCLHSYPFTKSRLLPLGHYLKPESSCLGSERITSNCMLLLGFFLLLFLFFLFSFFFLNGSHSRMHLHGLMAYQMAINDAFMWGAGQQGCVHSLHADVRWPLVGWLPGLLACLLVGYIPSGSGPTSVLYRAL